MTYCENDEECYLIKKTENAATFVICDDATRIYIKAIICMTPEKSNSWHFTTCLPSYGASCYMCDRQNTNIIIMLIICYYKVSDGTNDGKCNILCHLKTRPCYLLNL